MSAFTLIRVPPVERLVEITAGSDRRHRLARLTASGKQRRTRARKAWEQVQQEVAAEFGAAGVGDVLAGLRRLLATSERLNSAGPRAVGRAPRHAGER